jgi:hypothetical protein
MIPVGPARRQRRPSSCRPGAAPAPGQGTVHALTLAIAAQPGSGASLSCSKNPVTASAGVASFAGCKITGKAGSYTLKATDGSLTSATSSSFSLMNFAAKAAGLVGMPDVPLEMISQ